MIILNGKKFAANNKEFVSSLFDRSGTCVGYYKHNKKGEVVLMDHQRNKVGVINRQGVLCNARRLLGSKRYWYSYADIDIIGPWDSYMQNMQKIDELQAALAGK